MPGDTEEPLMIYIVYQKNKKFKTAVIMKYLNSQK